MPVNITFETDPDRIELKYTGAIPENEFKEAIMEFIRFNAERKCLLVLTDLREITLTPSILNVYDMINMFEKMGIDKNTSEALIMPENKFAADNIKFYETACQNKGYNVKIFYTKEEALKWLSFYM